MRKLNGETIGLVVAVLLAGCVSNQQVGLSRVVLETGAVSSLKVANCSGNACEAVIYRREGNRNYWRNTSPDRAIKIEVSNWNTAETIKIPSGEEKCSFLDLFFDPYKASYGNRLANCIYQAAGGGC